MPQKGSNPPSAGNRYNFRSNDRGQDESSSDQSRRTTRLPSVPTCHYCKRKEHIMSECWALDKKEKSKKTNLPIGLAKNDVEKNTITMGQSDKFKPFISQGLISLIGEEDSAKPISILRDTGASQSLMLKDVLPLSQHSFTGNNVLIQGVELGVISVPLH